jgi:LysR family transcriptional regulator, low CO2-responsive transcriptional regulator
MHSTPTPKQLQAFNAVAEHGGFTKAAEALGVTQPAVTIQVRMLEKDRRVRLFERRGDGVFLTDAGHSLHAVTRRIFRLIQDADDVLGAADALHFGNLRLGIDSLQWAMEVLAKFLETHPKIHVSAVMGNATATLRNLMELRCDIAVVTLSHEARAMLDGIDLMRLAPHRLRLLVPTGHTLCHGAPVSFADIADAPVILRETGSETRRSCDKKFAAASITPRVVLELGSREAVREAVAAGLGIAPMVAGEEGHDPRTEIVELSDGATDTWISVAWLSDRQEIPAVRGFVEIAGSWAREREQRLDP